MGNFRIGTVFYLTLNYFYEGKLAKGSSGAHRLPNLYSVAPGALLFC